MKKPKIIFIAIFILIIILSIIIYSANHQSIPLYQKNTGKIDLSAICKKISNQNLQQECNSFIENPDKELSLSILEKIREESKDMLLCHSIPLSVFLNLASNSSAQSLIKFSPYQESESPFSEYLLCYKSLTENPYYCGKISYFYEVLSQDNCFTDATLAWSDPSLCLKAKDKDRCYLRLAIKLINEN